MAKFRQTVLAGAMLGALGACSPQGGFDLANLDPDLRGFGGGGLDTAPAAAAAAPRPSPDQRGVITYPGYQVAIARQGDTVATVAARLGLNAAELAGYNAIDASAQLNAGAVIALPRRVPGATGPVVSATGQMSDPFAGQAQGRTAAAAGDGGVTTTTLPTSAQPQQHVVASGETAWSIARRYNVSANDLAKWNGLSPNMALRVGQRLLIPVAGQSPRAQSVVTAPGAGSPTPPPPSSSQPLPRETTRPSNAPVATPASPNLGQTRTAASGNGRFRMPANGAIIRTYEKGKNEGIDISAAPGSTISAAGAGTVAAITRDVDQVPIIVVRHENNMMTVYAGLDNVAVTKGQAVSAGTSLGKATSQGVVHFEVRNGFESVDPEKYLN